MPAYEVIKQLIGSTYTIEQYPTLAEQIERYSSEKPLKGLEIVDATPIFRNTLTKYLPLLASGAKLSVGISDFLPNDKKVVTFLEGLGIKTVSNSTLYKSDYDVILDCAGAFSNFNARIGYVELTRSGVEKYKDCSKPVFVADSGKIKRIETMLGTGESLFRALKQLGYQSFNNKKIIVFGSGKVGSGIILYGHSRGAEIVTITDPRSVIKATEDKCKVISYKDIDTIIEEVEDTDFIITATGVKNVISSKPLAQAITNSKAILANMGVEDEFGEFISDSRVLNNNRPLNFILEEPTHLKYIETTMALHNEGAIEVLKNHNLVGVFEPDSELESRMLSILRTKGEIGKELELINF